MQEFSHKPVLLDEVISSLNLKEGMTVIDGTLGGGGHSAAILEKIGPTGRLIGIDRDNDALAHCKEKFKGNPAFCPVKSNYCNMKEVCQELGIQKVDAILLDLGVSSYQLDNVERGFSYMHDCALDMRMDTTQELCAHDVVNNMSAEELAKIIWEYGEDKFSRRIAEFIVKNRPINTTFELNKAIEAAIPAKFRREGPHPSKRTYQAIRIYVNNELQPLEDAIKDAVSLLNVGGRLGIISFHSLEARTVKTTMKYLELSCICPKQSIICTCDKVQEVKMVTKKPLVASDAELLDNPRARSAELRVCEKVAPVPKKNGANYR